MASQHWYQVGLQAYALLPAVGAVLLAIDAPHGRFNASNLPQASRIKSIWYSPKFNVNGQIAWIIMELPSPFILIWTFHHNTDSPPSSCFAGPVILFSLFILHYLNRAIISPLRTPSRSPSHIIVPIAAVLFNSLNGSLIGAFLAFLLNVLPTATGPPSQWSFWAGIFMFVTGFVSNVAHDEVLLEIRRQPGTPSATFSVDGEGSRPRYAIPYGGLYRFVSFPNYMSEWFEWTGFAIAASSLVASLPRNEPVKLGLGAENWYTPPWMFVVAEVAVMLPRAIRGHQWYYEKFKTQYPRERKAVIPFVL